MTPVTLDELDAREHVLMAQLTDARGKANSEELERHVYEGYCKVHRRYTELLSQPDCAEEALKRAVFIQWFSVAEPAFLSGIGDLDPASWKRVLRELERRAPLGDLDKELLGMLAWYFVVADFAFGPAEAFPHLHALAQTLMADPPQVPRPLAPERGRMSRYWNSLARAE